MDYQQLQLDFAASLVISFNAWVLKLITDLTSFTFLLFIEIKTNHMSQ